MKPFSPTDFILKIFNIIMCLIPFAHWRLCAAKLHSIGKEQFSRLTRYLLDQNYVIKMIYRLIDQAYGYAKIL